MDIRKMRYFVAVVDSGSFTQAAKVCHISQTAISQQIAAMENELGATLFDRGGGHISLTRAGESFLLDCRSILDHYDMAVERVDSIAKGMEGSLKIGLWGLTDSIQIARLLYDFQQQNSKVQTSYTLDTFSGLLRRLNSGYLDLMFGFLYDMEDAENVDKMAVLEDEVGLVVPPMHPLSKVESMPAADVGKVPLVLVKAESGPGVMEHMLEGCRKDGYQPLVACWVDNYEEMLMSVITGRGAALLPQRTVDFFGEHLHYIHLEGTHHFNTFMAAWNRNSANPMVKLFIQHMRRSVGQMPIK